MAPDNYVMPETDTAVQYVEIAHSNIAAHPATERNDITLPHRNGLLVEEKAIWSDKIRERHQGIDNPFRNRDKVLDL